MTLALRSIVSSPRLKAPQFLVALGRNDSLLMCLRQIASLLPRASEARNQRAGTARREEVQ